MMFWLLFALFPLSCGAFAQFALDRRPLLAGASAAGAFASFAALCVVAS
jgi:hypothetical protein